MLRLVCGLLAFHFTPVWAVTYGVGNRPYALVAADVTGDGWPDLIAANYSDNSLTVLTNNGQGGFNRFVTLPAGSGPRSVVATDGNRDGWVDLVCANHGDNTLTVLTNNGSGGFGVAATLSTVGGGSLGTTPEMVAAADVNGDGWPDLISANFGNSGSLTVLTNDGSGGFKLDQLIALASGTFAVVAADINNQGGVDLICANYATNTLSVFTNNGRGWFGLAASQVVAAAPYSVVAVDVNGDHAVDLVCANLGTLVNGLQATYLTILTNNRAGGFGSNAAVRVDLSSLYTPFTGSSLLAAADVNGDGWPDVLQAHYGYNQLGVLTNGWPYPPASVPPAVSLKAAGGPGKFPGLRPLPGGPCNKVPLCWAAVGPRRDTLASRW